MNTFDTNERYLTEQIITYLGNKRSLLDFIDSAVQQVQKELGRTAISTVDLFSGSGIVARYFKTFASCVHANDLEGYSERINRCYLMNPGEYDEKTLCSYYRMVLNELKTKGLHTGFIAEMYAPNDDDNIQPGERVFYTKRNAEYLDTVRQILDKVPEPYQTMLLAPLMHEASVKNNTAGVFKGFYKNSKTNCGQFGGNGRNALMRIMADIELNMPVLCNRTCEYHIHREDANELVKKLPAVDLIYMDPPYNQHPYGSNYFMLNLLDTYERPAAVSEVAGIPTEWNKSQFNKKQHALNSMRQLCRDANAKYVLISFNSDGFISYKEMTEMLSELGEVTVYTQNYPAYRASRNLHQRDLHIKEYLYLLRKDEV